MDDRVKTGIDGLDKMLSGGMLAGSINLVEGAPGTGKTILAAQFLNEGLSSGESGVYLSLEEDKDSFYETMSFFGWDFKSMEGDKRFFYEYFRSEELGRHITEGYQILDNKVMSMGAKRLVIDSVAAYILISEKGLHERNELLKLFDNLRKWGVTVLLTSGMPGSRDAYGIDYMVDSIIRPYYPGRTDDSSPRKRFIEVEKMRGSTHSQMLHEMKITDKGIQVLGNIY
ncbi:RAD55 family ATPase [Candidatus Altiarchaeota archaeon]